MSHIQDDMLFIGIADKTVGNTASETSAVPTSGINSNTVQGDWWQVGRTLRIEAYGIYTTPAVTGGTATIRVKLGSTVIASVATTALLVGATNSAFHFAVTITCRTTGASGSVVIGGAIDYQVASNTRIYDNLNNGGSATTVDTTASHAVDVTIQWDTASASKTATVNIATMELLES